MKRFILAISVFLFQFFSSAILNAAVPEGLPATVPFTTGGQTFDKYLVLRLSNTDSCSTFYAFYFKSSEMEADGFPDSGDGWGVTKQSNGGPIFCSGDLGDHHAIISGVDLGDGVCGWKSSSTVSLRTNTFAYALDNRIGKTFSDVFFQNNMGIYARPRFDGAYANFPYSFTGIYSSYGTIDINQLIVNSSINLKITRSPELGGGVSDYPTGENILCGVDGHNECSASYPLNAEVTLDAYPNEGYEFSHWEINDLAMADVDGSIDVTMSENKNVVAVFYLKADDFVFPVLADGTTDPLLNKFNPIEDGWSGPSVGEYSAAAGHLGQDYVINYNNGDGNAAGEPVYSIANGTIVEVINNQNTPYGWCNDSDHGWGPVVVIRHENRDGFNTNGSIIASSCATETNPTVIYSLYGHLSKTSIQNLQIGQTVTKGQQLGLIGAYEVDQASWTTNHLHFELKDEIGYTEGV
ncbi:MAG: peptidoglycan DD-metalloendopeptidase family protein [Candidatus Moraniibacteriota bacterium]